MNRRAFLSTAGTAGAAWVAGCQAGGLSESDYDIGMDASAFVPDTYEVTVGETVVWGNNSTRGHTVTAYEKGIPEDAGFFHSGDAESTSAAREAWESTADGNVLSGETYAHTFETVGEHDYFCIPHERNGMAGVIVVTE